MTTKTKKQKENLALRIPSKAPLPLAVALTSDEMTDNQETIVYPNSEDGLHVSEDVYWEDYYEHPDFNYEWNNGILEEKGVSNIETCELADWFWQLLREYLKHNPIAKTIGFETGGRISLADDISIRKPDLGVVLNSNPVPLKAKDNSYHGTFDICIEAISKTKEKYRTSDTVTKKEEYALGGVKEYYILDADGEDMVFYRLNEDGVYEEIQSEHGVIKSEVLPGFQFRLSDLYKRPPVETLIYDEVYKHFVDLRFQTTVEAHQQEIEARKAAEAEIERLKALLEAKKNK